MQFPGLGVLLSNAFFSFQPHFLLQWGFCGWDGVEFIVCFTLNGLLKYG